MTDARKLYHDRIIELDRHPPNEGELDAPTHRAKRRNPLCGDRIQIDLAIDGGRIHKARFVGRGCAISRASSALLTEMVMGLTPEQARELAGGLESWLRGCTPEPIAAGLEPLSGVRTFPGRIECATLAWQALVEALSDEMPTSS